MAKILRIFLGKFVNNLFDLAVQLKKNTDKARITQMTRILIYFLFFIFWIIKPIRAPIRNTAGILIMA